MSTKHEHKDVPAWPVYDLVVHDDGRVVASGPLVPTTGHATRASAIGVVAVAAAGLGRAVRATATEPGGEVWQLVISPDGEVTEVPAAGSRGRGLRRRRWKRREKAAAAAPGPTPHSGERKGTGTGTYEESLDQVRDHLEAGRTEQAGVLAAQLDTRAAGILGVSHPETLRVREVRARATALAGDTVAGIQLYRDVAERWHYQGDGERAEAVASVAELLWMGITDVDEALAAGVAVVRMRSQIPGQDGDALTAVLKHREWLLKARAGNGPGAHTPGGPGRSHDPNEPGTQTPSGPGTPDPSGPEVRGPSIPEVRALGAEGSPAPRSSRPAPSWERPAVATRKAG
ncbi:hypothetical protein ABZ119_17150 [Streptomyces sp. NPDC006288]|uniref:hypothetical protein n=1 Tax=Streptomyces sp. NPDC006288 TaxID=3156743 RepID=UPI0033A9D8DF